MDSGKVSANPTCSTQVAPLNMMRHNGLSTIRSPRRRGPPEAAFRTFVRTPGPALAKRQIERERALLQAIQECLALDELHHEVVGAIAMSDVVERADVGMVQ